MDPAAVRIYRPWLFLMLVILVSACAPASPGAPREDASPGQRPPGRTLVMAARVEPVTLSTKVLQSTGGVSIGSTGRLFTASLTALDAGGSPRPYLAEVLPQLNSDDWRVFPDGRMQTTYHLRPNLVWHDGTPLTAEDFVFAYRLLSAPEVGEGGYLPQSAIEEAVAPDPRTLVIRWRQPFNDAGTLGEGGGNRNLLPYPRHILETPFQAQPDLVATHPFWSTGYVGLGPFRLDRWEPGAFIEGSAFDRYVWGRPKIDRIRIIFIPDANAALANLLSGEAHVTLDDTVRFEQGSTLRREWGPRNAGAVLAIPDQWRRSELQHRAEYATPKALLDVRVRRALAHTVDKQSLNDVLFEGEGIMGDTVIPPTVEYFALLDRTVAKYPYDPRRAEQLMTEAGLTRGLDGFYAAPTEGRLTWELKVNAGPQAEREMAIMAAGWRQVGFDFQQAVLPSAQSRDGQIRATFPTIFTGGGTVGDEALANFTSNQIPTLENRWNGSNRGGYFNPEYDRLVAVFTTNLDRSQRGQLAAQVARVFTEDVGSISLYYNPGIVAHVAALTGPQAVSPETSRVWNVHEWEFR